jgi:hypothetical protein
MAEHWKRRDIDASARQIQGEKQNDDLKLRLKELEEKNTSVWESSKDQVKVIQALRNELDESTARNKDLER